MKILIAPDSFKDCLSANEVGEYLKSGMQVSHHLNDIHVLPLADGGEGTVDALVNATSGKILTAEVFDPLSRPIKAEFGLLGDNETAVIEMSAASGIELLKPEERNPWLSTTYGTGQLILHALKNGCKNIIVGIGGSATNDGGVGMAQALGYSFLDADGKEIERGGGALGNICSIVDSVVTPLLHHCTITVACDVDNPLTGPNGASYVYGPQKGADKTMVEKLDKNLNHLANLVKSKFNIDVATIPGAGAAGGLGAGLVAFANGKLQKGFDIVRRESNLDKLCEWADIVITGEGKIDFQTKFGKTPKGVADAAKRFNKPVFAVAGTLGKNYTELYDEGFDGIFSIVNGPTTLQDALKDAGRLLQDTGLRIAKMLETMQRLK